jgi:hypothetical protein
VTRSRLWVALAVLLPILASLIARISTIDLAYHLRAGEEILTTAAIPTVDTWTFTVHGRPWVDQQWAAQVALRMVESVGGWVGLAAFRAAMIGLIFGGVALIGIRKGLDLRTSSWLALAAFGVAAPALALRPQLLGMACLVVVLLLVVDRRRHPQRLWLGPIVVAIWANLHGSFFLGPLVLGLAWLEDMHDRSPDAMRTLTVTVASVAAACLTPFGPMVWVYAAGLSTNPAVTARITEWQPTSLRDVTGIIFFTSVAVVGLLIARSERRVAWPTLAWLAAFAFIGVYAQRGVAWWPLGAAAALASSVIQPAATPRIDPPMIRRINGLIVASLIAAAAVALPWWRPIEPETGLPVGVAGPAPPGITAAVRDAASPGDHVYVPQIWGSWFEYAVPNVLVAVDSRIELFPLDVWQRFDAVSAGRGDWQTQLEDWNVGLVVTAPTDEGFSARLRAAGWLELYRDGDGAVFGRG